MRRPTEYPTWVSVLSALRRLPDDSPVTLEAFRTVHAERDWHFAIYQFGPDGPTGPRRGPSPWLAFIDGHHARTVRRLLPLWVSHRVLPPINADDFAAEIIRSPELRLRSKMASTVAAILAMHPSEYGWLMRLLRELNPDPLLFSSDGDVEDDLPFGDPEPRSRSQAQPSTPRREPQRMPDHTSAVSPETGQRVASTRPSLRNAGNRGV